MRGNVTHKPSIFTRVWELSQMELHPGPIEVKARMCSHRFTQARITSVTRTRTLVVLCPDLWPSETAPRTKENTIAFVPAQGLSPYVLFPKLQACRSKFTDIVWTFLHGNQIYLTTIQDVKEMHSYYASIKTWDTFPATSEQAEQNINAISMCRSQYLDVLSLCTCSTTWKGMQLFWERTIIQNQSTFQFVRELNIYIIMLEREKQFCIFFPPTRLKNTSSSSCCSLIFLKRESPGSSVLQQVIYGH